MQHNGGKYWKVFWSVLSSNNSVSKSVCICFCSLLWHLNATFASAKLPIAGCRWFLCSCHYGTIIAFLQQKWQIVSIIKPHLGNLWFCSEKKVLSVWKLLLFLLISVRCVELHFAFQLLWSKTSSWSQNDRMALVGRSQWCINAMHSPEITEGSDLTAASSSHFCYKGSLPWARRDQNTKTP